MDLFPVGYAARLDRDDESTGRIRSEVEGRPHIIVHFDDHRIERPRHIRRRHLSLRPGSQESQRGEYRAQQDTTYAHHNIPHTTQFFVARMPKEMTLIKP